ncbi:DUF3997 domain-containing protein [Polluticoccus soli]|uniref:DUF3997 domain-containing protein n=1 Tax=Polluticoccus soli TaxID=3034150 RepID=UPI0023E345D7|nr:DUF3997 domain-containing protein [Flavipsychrobacter sp. JY13-12]
MARLGLLIAFSILLVACNMSDSSKKLSGNYCYRWEGGGDKVILRHSGSVRDNIYGEVVDYEYNDDFIIAMQRPDFKTHAHYLAFELPGDEIEKDIREAESTLRTEPYYIQIFSNKLNYWIISHNHNKTFGPLTKSEFQKLHDSLNIDEDLNFD